MAPASTSKFRGRACGRRSVGLGSGALALLLLGSAAHAQISAPPLSRERDANGEILYRNSIGIGGSIGSPYQRDAYFWGGSLSYTRVFHYPWSATGTLTFDQEHDRPEQGPVKVTNTFSAVATIDYALTDKLMLSTGIGRGFANDEKGHVRFADGDWGTGISLGISLPNLPFTVKDSVSLSVAWEWNISQGEPSISADLTFGWGF